MTASATHTPAAGNIGTGRALRDQSLIATWVARHGASLVWVAPLLAITAVVQAWNMTGTPQRIDDEGTYTAQAWAIGHLGELTHYTYWYDHPPLGWIQIAGYTQLTGAWLRYPYAVDAAREAMVFFAVVSAALLFVLGRKLGLSRAGATVAGLLFALSPLAVQYHRTVYIDNVATPWLIAAFVFALSRRQQLAGFTAAAACLGVAVLSKETYLLALPFVAWIAIRRADPSTRRYALSVAGAVLAIIGGGYIMLAAVKGELLPRSGQVSLLDGITYQLGSRNASGSIFDPSSLASKAVSQWWDLDPVFIVFGSAAAIVGLFLRRVRPIAALLVFLLAMMFRPNGYLPVPYVIMLIPIGAVLVAYTAERAVIAVMGLGRRRVRARRAVGLTWLVACAAALVVAVPLWTVQLRGFFLADLDKPMQQAENWVGGNVPKSSRLLVDDAMWVDLVHDGFARDNVIWYYKLDTDGAVERQSPDGWRDSDYVVTTDSMRTGGTSSKDVHAAIANSSIVASFGTGDQEVDVRRIHSEGHTAARTEITRAADVRKTLGTQLARNPGLHATDEAASQLRAGQVDQRAILVLGQLLAAQTVRLDTFTPLPGETGQTFRRLVVHGTSTAATVRMQKTLQAMTGTFQPKRVLRSGDTLTITFSAIDPATTVVTSTP
ncbi:glycosyltransferase family 39 protein [Curtobacterium sp. MCBD17_019]|uniref:ArnT family glycosyltransferase n=1 Tax=Curtobacterium sp. MCBD17_019 TaxID=2175669 RepID=UPI000DA97C7A|nr:glycosyltransferase family 39 protein [Curtobacterium sp. MCBD17_019]PZE71632.1 glycosyltransferase [Curtobacterium sp. MCBD17_019]